MHRLRALWARLLGTFGWKVTGNDFDEELESHIGAHIEDGVRRGLTLEQARRHALLRLGGIEQARQKVRERGTLPWLEHLGRDLRYALRGFRRNPVFALTAVVTLTLGIGATAAVFSVVDRVLFRSLPYAHDDRLVSVGLVQSLERQEFTLGGFYYEWRDNQRPFEPMTFERGVHDCNLTESNPLHLQCGWVAQNFLSTLGVSLAAGRNFIPEEDVPHGPLSVIISDALWLSRFNRDPTVLSKSIFLDDRLYRIVGVLPRDFEMPRMQSIDLLMPAQTDIAAQHTVNAGIGYPMWAFARLKPNVSLGEAKAEMEPLFLHTQLWIPAEFRKDFHLEVRSLRDRQMHDAYPAARVLLGAVLAVLLIACANVAGLLSARRAARTRDFAVRSALGASRIRLVSESLSESFLLALAGAALGCILAQVLLRVFLVIAPSGIPFLADARIDLRVMGFSLLAAFASACIAGLLPVVEKARAGALVSRAANSVPHTRLRSVLVALQVAISVVLLVGAMLLVRSFRNLQAQPLGMATRGVLALRLPLTSARYPTSESTMDFFLRAEAALRNTPGVTAVAISDSLPPDGDSWHDERRYSDLFVDGKPAAPNGTGGKVVVRIVTPDYFRVLKIPMVAGRAFSEEDRSSESRSLILSQLLASRLFPNANPVGRHVQFGEFVPYFSLDKQVFTVIGVAKNVKNAGLGGEDDPEYYQLRLNRPESWNGHTVLLLETELPVRTLGPWVRARVAQIDAGVPVEIETLSETVSRLGDRPRFETALLSFFAATGLLMAVIGLYGVVTFMAQQRTQEIGIRMALGATRADVLALILGEGLRLVMIGGAIGALAALALARVIAAILFKVDPHDPASFAAVAALLALVALVAILIPARSAMKTDPVNALRQE